MPAPAPATLAITAATALAAGAGVILWGGQPISAGALLTGAAMAAGALVASFRMTRHPARGMTMAIVPWGVLVDPDAELRVLRWAAIQRVTVDVSHALRGGTPVTIASVVTVDTGRERLVGRALGAVGLEGLTVNLEAYAGESARPVSVDLDGTEPVGDGATEPVMAELLARASDLCTTGRGAAILDLPAGGYRSMSASTAGPETLALLRSVLDSGDAQHPADARPLAAIVAVILGARDLVPDLLRLVSAPHPIVAAVARAAAVRLGAPQSRAGTVDEVAAFLFAEDHERIASWARESAA
jgi:hypothetical protein